MLTTKVSLLNILNTYISKILSNSFFSSSIEISNSDFNSLLQGFLNSTEFFFWSDRPNNKTFCTFGRTLTIDESLSGSDLNIVLTKIIDSSKFKNTSSTIPFIFSAQKFPAKERSNFWDAFKNNDWFIPQYVISNIDNNYVFTAYSKINNSTQADILIIIRKLLDQFSSESKIVNSNLKILGSFKYPQWEEWNKIINKSIRYIESGEIEKVVLGRYCDLEFSSDFHIGHYLLKLTERQSNSINYGIKRNDTLFFGATPEKLFSLKNNILKAEAVAGSIGRGENDSADEKLANELLKSSKNVREQSSVLKFLVSQLADISEKIEYENNPKIKKLRSIQHLISKIEAVLKPDVSIIEIIERLFPTPAVCGFPKERAIDIIQNLESFDRGLYAGILGWITPQYESEFAVAIRSAFLKDRKLRAFAGCGIIKESESEAEFLETELKFKTIISLFENENIN